MCCPPHIFSKYAGVNFKGYKILINVNLRYKDNTFLFGGNIKAVKKLFLPLESTDNSQQSTYFYQLVAK